MFSDTFCVALKIIRFCFNCSSLYIRRAEESELLIFSKTNTKLLELGKLYEIEGRDTIEDFLDNTSTCPMK